MLKSNQDSQLLVSVAFGNEVELFFSVELVIKAMFRGKPISTRQDCALAPIQRCLQGSLEVAYVRLGTIGVAFWCEFLSLPCS